MLCSRVAKRSVSVTYKRAGQLCKTNMTRLAFRGYSSSAQQSAGYTISPFLKYTLAGLGVGSAIYYVYPFEKKLPKKEEPKSEPEGEQQEPIQEQALQEKKEEVDEQKEEHVKQRKMEDEGSDQEESQEQNERQQVQDSESESEQNNGEDAGQVAEKTEANEGTPIKDQEGKPVEGGFEETDTEDDKAPKSEKESVNASDDATSEKSDVAEIQPSKSETITATDGHQPKKNIKSDDELQSLVEEQLGEKDKEANQEGAYNPDTGEINWDCPCLGGMAHGPCGEEFKDAFSCFVYSEAEPKGIDCVEKFQAMQDCFRKYPEHYAEQIKDEEEATRSDENKSSSVSEDSSKDTKVEKAAPVPAKETKDT